MDYTNPNNQTKTKLPKLLGLLALVAVALLAVGCNSAPPRSVTRSRAERPAAQKQNSSNLINSLNVTEQPIGQINYATPLTVGGNRISVAVMRTDAEMTRGLSGSESLRDDQGMLFAFDHELTPAFWMKDMKFNLDLIWIVNEKIIAINENVPAPAVGTKDKDLQQYYSPTSIDQVLEVNAGWTKSHKVKVGDKVTL